ncbi:single-stranded DNA-binding protein [Mucilaginibacter corticis]|uniref:Single-stranded DNA-binding protein n=1 Tax=Mucilaginibacter corticis TaxID=2597670 RepID=A0A556MLW8_9SPHI|nr:single-stranded DNA-binding protein [Mucilaginibacter corticis]TSJ40924.1 single-stranded DNA-binding protein [Mucilaginibacter corticis]
MSTLSNSVRLTGFLGAAPEVKFTDNEKKYVKLSLATNHFRKNDQGDRVKEVNWHPIVLWEQQATLAEKYLDKGSKIAVEGRLVSRYYTDKDGIKRHSMEVFVNEIDFLRN